MYVPPSWVCVWNWNICICVHKCVSSFSGKPEVKGQAWRTAAAFQTQCCFSKMFYSAALLIPLRLVREWEKEEGRKNNNLENTVKTVKECFVFFSLSFDFLHFYPLSYSDNHPALFCLPGKWQTSTKIGDIGWTPLHPPSSVFNSELHMIINWHVLSCIFVDKSVLLWEQSQKSKVTLTLHNLLVLHRCDSQFIWRWERRFPDIIEQLSDIIMTVKHS